MTSLILMATELPGMIWMLRHEQAHHGSNSTSSGLPLADCV